MNNTAENWIYKYVEKLFSCTQTIVMMRILILLPVQEHHKSKDDSTLSKDDSTLCRDKRL